MATSRRFADPARSLPIAATPVPAQSVNIGDVIRFTESGYMPGIDRVVTYVRQTNDLHHMVSLTVFPSDGVVPGDNQTYTILANTPITLRYRAV